MILIDPRGEFPNSDDWAYIESVHAIVERGKLYYSDWAAANLISHFVWGSLFGWLFGVSYFTMRISTMVAALLGGIALYRLMRLIPVEPGVALLGALVWLFNPLCLALSFSFMSDISFTMMALWSLVLLTEGARRGGRLVSGLGWFLGTAALLSRQIGIALPIGWAAGRFSAVRRFSIGWLALLALPTLAFIIVQLVFQKWLLASGIAPKLFGRNADGILTRLIETPLDMVRLAAKLILDSFPIFGILTLPLGIALAAQGLAAMPARYRRILLVAGLAGALALAAAFIATGRIFPNWPGTLHAKGLGDLEDVLTPQWLLVALTAMAPFGGIIALALVFWSSVRVLLGKVATDGFDVIAAAIATGAVIFAAIMMVSFRFDRYLIAVLPYLLLAMAGCARGLGRSPAGLRAGMAATLAMAMLSVPAMHDYLAAKRTQAALYYPLAAKVGGRNIDAGWVLNGPNSLDILAGIEPGLPLDFGPRTYVIEPAETPRRGYEVVQRVPVKRWLTWREKQLPFLVERQIVAPR